jgi:hypothetical protein
MGSAVEQQRLQRVNERGNATNRDEPDSLLIDLAVFVREDVALADDLLPRDLGASL